MTSLAAILEDAKMRPVACLFGTDNQLSRDYRQQSE
jgi:hypothetical protein